MKTQKDANNDLPIGIAIMHRQSHLIQAMLFDSYDELGNAIASGAMTFEDETQEQLQLQEDIKSNVIDPKT